MKTIALNKGLEALVDDEDYDRIVGIGKWFAYQRDRTIYARHSTSGDGARRKTVQMHSLILPSASWIDHINGNGLDNRRSNLRPASPLENARNRRARRDSGTGFKGVGRNKSTNRPWYASISLPGGRRIYLGGHATPEEAARAYDAAAREHFGEFARLNFPNGEPA
jgi:hypothetical protein